MVVSESIRIHQSCARKWLLTCIVDSKGFSIEYVDGHNMRDYVDLLKLAGLHCMKAIGHVDS